MARRDQATQSVGGLLASGAARRRLSSPIAAARRRVAALDLPQPSAIPCPSAFATALPATLRDVCRAELSRPRARIGRLARHLEPGRGTVAPVRVAFRWGQTADIGTHDAFFRVRRSSGDPMRGFVLGLFRGIAILRADLEAAPTRLTPARTGQIAGALTDTLAAVLGMPAPTGSFAVRPAPARAPQDYAAERWVRGHQLFACLSQGLIFALHMLAEADAGGDRRGMTAAAALMSRLLDASAASLELTGDFPPDIYTDTIRVSMESPFLPEGFSGLLSGDHRHLVVLMKALRPVLDRLREQNPDAHAGIVASLNGVYRSHQHVCAHFVGTDQSSLLMNQTAAPSAVQQLERFRHMRLRQMGSCPAGSGDSAAETAQPIGYRSAGDADAAH